MTTLDLKGQRFGRLVCGDRHPEDVRRVLVTCDCGESKYVRMTHLRSGAQQSCGCLWRETIKSGVSRRTHGLHKSPEYKSWEAMIQRCTNPRNPAYKNYGARGIEVHPAWVSSFESFLQDMGPRPKNTSLERVDNSQGYFPSNCKWAPRTDQNRNTRGNVLVNWFGKSVPLSVAYEESGSTKANSTVYKHVKKGRPIWQALWPFRANEETRPQKDVK